MPNQLDKIVLVDIVQQSSVKDIVSSGCYHPLKVYMRLTTDYTCIATNLSSLLLSLDILTNLRYSNLDTKVFILISEKMEFSCRLFHWPKVSKMVAEGCCQNRKFCLSCPGVLILFQSATRQSSVLKGIRAQL